MKKFVLSFGLSILILIGSAAVSSLLSFGGKFSPKGFPFAFYMPGGSDYGPSFYTTEFLLDLALCTVAIFFALVLFCRLKKPVR